MPHVWEMWVGLRVRACVWCRVDGRCLAPCGAVTYAFDVDLLGWMKVMVDVFMAGSCLENGDGGAVFLGHITSHQLP